MRIKMFLVFSFSRAHMPVRNKRRHHIRTHTRTHSPLRVKGVLFRVVSLYMYMYTEKGVEHAPLTLKGAFQLQTPSRKGGKIKTFCPRHSHVLRGSSVEDGEHFHSICVPLKGSTVFRPGVSREAASLNMPFSAYLRLQCAAVSGAVQSATPQSSTPRPDQNRQTR